MSQAGESTTIGPAIAEPADQVRSALQWGIVGALLDIGLCWVEMVLELRPAAAAPSLWWNDLATLLRVGAQALILVAFLQIARTIVSVELWRSTVGAYGFSWLVIALSTMPMEGPLPARWEVIVFAAVVMFAIVATVESFKRPWIQALPVAVPLADGTVSGDAGVAPVLDYAPAPPSKASWGYGGLLFLVYLVCKYGLAKHSGYWLAAVMLLLGLLVIGATVFTVRLAIAKIRTADRTTPLMSLSGWIDLAVLVAGAGVLVSIVVNAAMSGPDALDRAPRPLLIAVAAISTVATGAVALALLAMLRRLSPRS